MKVVVYHNHTSRFRPYRVGDVLVAVTCHWLDSAIVTIDAAADWAFHAFNADLDTLETDRGDGGETTFLAACMYRPLGHRSLSVGDVVALETDIDTRWLACESIGWRTIDAPSYLAGHVLTAEAVYQRLANR